MTKLTIQESLFATAPDDQVTVAGFTPFYVTNFGAAYLEDSLSLLRALPDKSRL